MARRKSIRCFNVRTGRRYYMYKRQLYANNVADLLANGSWGMAYHLSFDRYGLRLEGRPL